MGNKKLKVLELFAGTRSIEKAFQEKGHDPQFKPMCKNGDLCHVSAPRGSRTGTQGLKSSKERSVIPKQLCEHIVSICERYFEGDEGK